MVTSLTSGDSGGAGEIYEDVKTISALMGNVM